MTSSRPAARMTAAQAVSKANQSMQDSKWQIAFLSNTGVTQSVSGEESHGADGGLIHNDGTAAQWVVEMFKDSPKPFSEGGRVGKSYPFQIVRVTAKGVSKLPASEMAVPVALSPLKPRYVSKLDTAGKLAAQQVKASFNAVSVASDVKSDGSCFWRFRFYDLKSQNVVAKVRISGDGTKALDW